MYPREDLLRLLASSSLSINFSSSAILIRKPSPSVTFDFCVLSYEFLTYPREDSNLYLTLRRGVLCPAELQGLVGDEGIEPSTSRSRTERSADELVSGR